MGVLQLKEGEELLLSVREAITFPGYFGTRTDFRVLLRG